MRELDFKQVFTLLDHVEAGDARLLDRGPSVGERRLTERRDPFRNDCHVHVNDEHLDPV